nr:prepilin-type N-terminal cleavage/methylation domain-containing protein [Azoarcus sp. L1K30]
MTPRPCPARRRATGFTLVEMAVVLVILALVTGMLIVPVNSHLDARNRQDTESRLRDIEQTLIGFAILNGRLPCPTTETDPASPGYGLEHTPPCDHSHVGYLPWRTLGVSPTDAWGRARDRTDSPWTGYWRYRADSALTDAPITPVSATSSNIQILDHVGRAITTLSDSRAAAVVFSTGPNRAADGLNATHAATKPSFEAGEITARFDDQLHWIGHPLLIARLAQAGRL